MLKKAGAFAAMVARLLVEGHTLESARRIAAAACFAKFGKKKCVKKAVEGMHRAQKEHELRMKGHAPAAAHALAHGKK